MTLRPRSCLCATPAIAALLFAAPTLAAGPWIAETGGSDTGLAGAGRAALALDAASLSSNPAAMGELPASSATAAILPLQLEYDYHGSAATPGHASNHDGVTTLPALYAVRHGERSTAGFGAYTYFGLSFDSGNTWAGRRAVEQSGVQTFNLGPAVAWNVNDKVTLGASLAAQLAKPQLRVAVANDAVYYGPPAGLPDGQLAVSGDSWAVAGQLGVLYTPRPGTRIGLAWTAPVDHTVALDLDARKVHPVLATLLPADGVAKLDFTLPQQVLLGVTHRASPGTLLALGVSWQDWSALGQAENRMPGLAAPLFPTGLRDTWGASLGIRQTCSDRWTASAGIGYESSPATEGGVPAYFPVADQWRLATSLERDVTDNLRLRGSVVVMWQGDARVEQTQHPLPLPGIPSFTGSYQDTRVYLLSVAADYRL